MLTKQQYEQNELLSAVKEETEVDCQSLADRKESQLDVACCMSGSPCLFAERVGWLLAGNYGLGPMLHAKRVLALSARANKIAQLCHLTAIYEWRCPRRHTVAAWKQLTKTQQKQLSECIKAEILEYEQDNV